MFLTIGQNANGDDDRCRQLAEDQTLWATIAAASNALLIAVVLVEVRTRREEPDEQALKTAPEGWRPWRRATMNGELGRLR